MLYNLMYAVALALILGCGSVSADNAAPVASDDVASASSVADVNTKASNVIAAEEEDEDENKEAISMNDEEDEKISSQHVYNLGDMDEDDDLED